MTIRLWQLLICSAVIILAAGRTNRWLLRIRKNIWLKFRKIDNEVPITYDNCQVPLGVGNSGPVPRYRLQASDGPAYKGRLHQPAAWISRRPLYVPGSGLYVIGTQNAWLQVNLLRKNLITGIQTQGDPQTNSWVSFYYVFVSEDCQTFSPITDADGLIARYNGNHDSDTVSSNYFHVLTVAKCVRVVPLEAEGNKTALRVEILGCDERICKEAVIHHMRADEIRWPPHVPEAQGTASEVLSGSIQHGQPYQPSVSQLDIDIITQPTFENENFAEFQFATEKLLIGMVLYPEADLWDRSEQYTVNYSRNCLKWEVLGRSHHGRQSVIFSRDPTNFASVWFTFPHARRAHCVRILHRNATLSNFNIRAHFIGCGTGDSPGRQCGRPRHPSHLSRQKRVIGGQPISFPFKWPWLVSLKLMQVPGQYQHACGGSIIKQRWVLTAAHCIAVLYGRGSNGELVTNYTQWSDPDFLEMVFVTVGEHSLAVTDGPQHHVGVDKIIVHSAYNITNFQNDIALMRLKEELQFVDQISPVCLYSSAWYQQERFDGSSNCQIAGWGKTYEAFPDRPHQTHIPIVEYNRCKSIYDHVNVTVDMLCAGTLDGSRDACSGDSGGPLICESTSGQWVQVGIASWNIGCGYVGFPAVYANVEYFTDWINQQTSD